MKKAPIAKSTSSTTTTALIALGVTLGLLQATIGLVSLTPKLTADYHREIRNQYQTIASSLKFVHDYLGRFNLAATLRCTFGTIQLLAGLLLVESGRFSGNYHNHANRVLAATQILLLGLQIQSGLAYDLWAYNLVFIILLVARLTLVAQCCKKQVAGSRSKVESKPKTSTPKKKHN